MLQDHSHAKAPLCSKHDCNHRYLKNIDCLSFVVCPLLAPHLPRHFPFFAAATNSTNETNKAGNTSHLSVYLSLDVYGRDRLCEFWSNEISPKRRMECLLPRLLVEKNLIDRYLVDIS